MDLKELLGEELYNQVIQKVGDNRIDIVSNGNWIPKDKFDALDEQLKNANTTITDLKKSNKDNEELQTKVINYETKVKDYEKKIQDMQFNYALEGALKGANVRNTKAVKALLNLEGVKLDGENVLGLSEQIEALKKSDSYLFAEEQKPKFSGVEPTDGSKTPQGYNPWKKESFNLTDQGKIFKENPEQAKQLMAQVGINQ
ncbi:phage scaffolding protein [Clostridium botulinum]|uniref:phage scaffolding protein n=1 Tax=Clostridium botulinum TaxID=1491 RepID=UPI000D378844|nr:phage scaffolding protein [Clostridium botulinum]AWB31531.1 scaffolding protein [Clostridium botulinum]MBY6829241.1 phage scaffolding protein [Clostridium botulinum]MBY6941490.1 phage scaffolding protein [Clostridium botulinum]MBY6962360.1 phage scaffolding protein [Clostridium botulinum]MBY6997568.1 phage scaffolding protein [Clostridium botulinum]